MFRTFLTSWLRSNLKKLAAHLSSVTKMMMLGTNMVSMEGLTRLAHERPATAHGLYPTDVHKSRNQQRVQPTVLFTGFLM
jgi:hypothetical protein